jgi:hypothetical protein
MNVSHYAERRILFIPFKAELVMQNVAMRMRWWCPFSDSLKGKCWVLLPHMLWYQALQNVRCCTFQFCNSNNSPKLHLLD